MAALHPETVLFPNHAAFIPIEQGSAGQSSANGQKTVDFLYKNAVKVGNPPE
jgi:hypothetical protein